MTKGFQWDWVVKITHWSVAILFIANFYFTDEGGDIHIWCGYGILGLVGLRLLWGLITHSPARLSSFFPSPFSALKHLKEVLKTRKDDHEGHNPAGAIMIWAMWLGLLTTGTSGWMMETDMFWAEIWVEELHETAANVTFTCVCIHVSAVILMSFLTGNRYIQTISPFKK
ncbi:cytochrome b/b6 domain-containing protein [Vibrio sp. RC27]